MSFQAGQLATCKTEWEKITTDPEVLETVTGLKITFFETPFLGTRKNQFSHKEEDIVDDLVQKFLGKKVITRSSHERGEIISPIFLREKPDGSHRLILNLKQTNVSVSNAHFKMETIKSILKLIYPNCYMASVDLKDAYYSVKVFVRHQKFLKFRFKGVLYQFTCLPNGLCSIGP